MLEDLDKCWSGEVLEALAESGLVLQSHECNESLGHCDVHRGFISECLIAHGKLVVDVGAVIGVCTLWVEGTWPGKGTIAGYAP